MKKDKDNFGLGTLFGIILFGIKIISNDSLLIQITEKNYYQPTKVECVLFLIIVAIYLFLKIFKEYKHFTKFIKTYITLDIAILIIIFYIDIFFDKYFPYKSRSYSRYNFSGLYPLIIFICTFYSLITSIKSLKNKTIA